MRVLRASDFLPPVLRKIARSVRSAIGLGPRMYVTWESAVARSRGYENEDVIETVAAKTARLRDQLARGETIQPGDSQHRVLAAIGLSRSEEELRVIDFGGGCGGMYFQARALLPKSCPMRWHVIETPAMVERAREFENESLRLFTDLPFASRALSTIDLVLANSSIHYTSSPIETIRALMNLGAAHLFITRTGFTTGSRTFYTVQRSRLRLNGPGPLPEGMRDGKTIYPMSIAPLEAVSRAVAERYEVLFCNREDLRVYGGGRHAIDTWGIFGRLKRDEGYVRLAA